MDILTSCAASALIVRNEPHIYSSLRLLEVLEKLLRYGDEHNISKDPELIAIADDIIQNKNSCMSDADEFYSLVQGIAFALVRYQKNQKS